MNARELLSAIEARGGMATVRRSDGVPVLNIAPRHIALDFANNIGRLKLALVELLELPTTEPSGDDARARFPVHLCSAFCDDDRVAIGHCLLKLDAGGNIE